MRYLENQKGMTLIEVLIASVILFIAIGTVSGVHRVLNHYQRLNMADYALLLNQQSFFDYLAYNIENKTTSGIYEISQYKIAWSAKLNKKSPVIRSFNPELGIESGYSNNGYLSLYDISYYLAQYPEKKFEISQLFIE